MPHYKAKIAPDALYYMAIDGTEAVDSKDFGARLETEFGWHNVITGSFKDAPEQDPNAERDGVRLVDPAHPFLPIYRYPIGKRDVAIVSPAGRNGEGKEVVWQNYQGEDPSEKPDGRKTWRDGTKPTFGRHTAAEKSALFMNTLIFNPAIELDRGPVLDPHARLATGTDPSALRVAADLLYVSSHGWLGGFARGLQIMPRDEAAQPAPARDSHYIHHTYFLVGRAARDGVGFRGPRWVILAQCSTLNSATWTLWARVLAKSNPPVRGIVAYEETAPSAQNAVAISAAFFERLKAGHSFLEAWRGANASHGLKWAAIVHKNAIHDSLLRWRAFGQLGSIDTTATESSYLGFLADAPNGQPILDVPPAFECRLFNSSEHTEVTSDKLDAYPDARLWPNSDYDLKVQTHDGAPIDSLLVQWVHIRPNYPIQPKTADIFLISDTTPAAAVDYPKAPGWPVHIAFTEPVPAVSVQFRARTRDELIRTGIESHHSYFWPRVGVITPTGRLSYDFRTVGLLFYNF